MSTLGERIRDARRARGMTQAELAKVLGKGKSTICNWEQGTNSPDVNVLSKLSKALQTPLNDLLGDMRGASYRLSLEEWRLVQDFRATDRRGQALLLSVASRERELAELHVQAVPAGTSSTSTSSASTPTVAPTPVVARRRSIRYIPLPVSAGTGIDLGADTTEDAIDIPLTDVSERADFVLRVSGDSMEPEYSDGDLLLIKSVDTVEPGQLGVFGVNGEGYFKRLGHNQLLSLNKRYQPIELSEEDDVRCFGRVLGTTLRV